MTGQLDMEQVGAALLVIEKAHPDTWNDDLCDLISNVFRHVLTLPSPLEVELARLREALAKVEAERADEWRRRREAEGSRDVAKAVAAELRDRAAALEALLKEATAMLMRYTDDADGYDEEALLYDAGIFLAKLRERA